jgi:hypothetical protein
MHLPINHRLRPTYRFLAGASGVYLLSFGITGLARTWGDSFFSRDDVKALGLRTNLAFALLSIIVGAVILVGAVIGNNADHFINTAGGVVFLLSGLISLLLMQTEANILNFEVATSIVSFIIGTVLLTAGMYGKTGSQAEEHAEDRFRHSARGAVVSAPKHRPSGARAAR